MSSILPIADAPMVRRETVELLNRHRRRLAIAIGLHATAAVAGLAGPVLLGRLIDRVVSGTATGAWINQLVVQLAVAVLIQAVLAGFAHRSSMVLGEGVFAELREQFLERNIRPFQFGLRIRIRRKTGHVTVQNKDG